MNFMDGKMEGGEGELPTINWFLSLSKPNLLSGEKQINSKEQNKIGGKRRRPMSSQHSSGHFAPKKGRRCNSAKANLLPENGASNLVDYGPQNVRPPFNNVQLAIQALKNCENQSGTINDILAILSTKFEYFRHCGEKESLKNSIRHALSQNNGGIFKKIKCAKNGRNAIWALASNSNEQQKCAKITNLAANKFDHDYAAEMPQNSPSSPTIKLPEEISPNSCASFFDNFEEDPQFGFGQFPSQILAQNVDEFEFPFGQQSPPIQDFAVHLDCANFILGKEWEDDELFLFNSANLL